MEACLVDDKSAYRNDRVIVVLPQKDEMATRLRFES